MVNAFAEQVSLCLFYKASLGLC